VTSNGGGIPPLRPYQLAPARAIIDSVQFGLGLTFTLEMARQSGKNQTSATLEATVLLQQHHPHLALPPTPINCIKVAPTLDPQVKLSRDRLRDILRAGNVPYAVEDGRIIRVGDARVTFLSAEPSANIVGHTAHPLLEIDEAQDVAIDKYDKEIKPFAAANNATTILYGTPWSELDLLGRERAAAQRAQQRDGIQRSFIVPWTIVATHLPTYRTYVEAERARLGPTHPMFTTQYEMQQLPGKGRLFSATVLEQLRGDWPRRDTRPPTARIVAGLDIAGGDDDRPEAHDRTVLTFAAVTHPTKAEPVPQNHVAVLQALSWQGTDHAILIPQLLSIINDVWRPDTLTIDATGIGETTAALLARGVHQRTTINAVKFTRPSKSLLGFDLQQAAITGHLKLFELDEADDASRTLWSELRLARADYLPGGFMNFYLDPSEGHDDYLISLALTNHAAQQHEHRVARGR
jgi:hypothetical protein